MAVLPICAYPEAVLRRKAELVAAIDETIQRLIDDMIQTMYDAPGIGLAAPQVGVSLRLFVVDVTSGRDASGLMTFINPEIVHMEGRIQEDEGCLSLPGVYGPTPRATQVVLRGLDRAGEMVEITGEGLLARALQHEMDHLQGTLFFNRMGPAARDLVMRKFKRAQRQRH
ncbi:MAG: peptide deformylase [Candidatus Tectomicrobia bacterium]|uniref:Peptide deformylase n=1 Tax=Tectimicrobiota bacterium TaxID=2528274 RepID=A0A937W2Y8_UNCTE|nr:peptide deformylase [Candidatus Tectomicrobia bacterium]